MSRPAKRAKKTLLAAKRASSAAQFLGGLRRSFAASPWQKSGCIRPAPHPGRLRCSSSNTDGTLRRRALPAGRIVGLGATPDFCHGLSMLLERDAPRHGGCNGEPESNEPWRGRNQPSETGNQYKEPCNRGGAPPPGPSAFHIRGRTPSASQCERSPRTSFPIDLTVSARAERVMERP